jgi:hypothetical protein
MMGTAGTNGNPKAADLVDRESSRVQAVAAFFPPTDFLNWGKDGNELLGPKRSRRTLPRDVRSSTVRQEGRAVRRSRT